MREYRRVIPEAAALAAPAGTPPDTLTTEKPLSPAERLLIAGVETVRTNEGFLNWLKVAAKFHEYSLHNQILIAMQKPDATRVMGYRKWQDVGRQVNKGESAIKIFYPQFGIVEQEDPDTGEKKKAQILRGFGIGNVFDVSQTDGEPLPEGPTFGDLNEPNAIAREVNLRLSRWLIEEGLLMESKDFPGNAHGFYNPGKNQIVMRQNESVDPLNLMKTKTLVHEAAHYIAGHGTEERYPTQEERSTAELVAEGSAYITLEHFGLDTSSYSWVYIAHWGGTPEQVKTNLDVISRVSKTVINAIDGVSDPFRTEPVSPSL